MSDAGGPQPEIRIDQLTGLRTILAAGRADRPIEFDTGKGGSGREAQQPPSDWCPFCEGNEAKTPPETWADRPGGGAADSPGWRVRAVPNLYPALSAGEGPETEGEQKAGPPVDPLRASSRGAEPDLFTATEARGVHEVVVNSPQHHTSLGELSPAELGFAMAGWRGRIRTHAEGHPCVQLIVNEGGGAGASLEHTHAQLYALSFVPVTIARERERFNAYNQRTNGGDLLADIASEEVRRKERLIAIDDDAMVICPWASRSPFELRIVPREVSERFEQSEAGVGALHTALAALRARFGEGLELNLWVRTAPRDAEVFHWHIDIAPRLTIKAGFELATGVDINVLAPERAASELREALG